MTPNALSGTLPNVAAFCQTSRSVARRERALGVALFRRTTRQFAPTEAARRYYARCVEALQLFSVAEHEAVAGRDAPEGQVRISVPTTYGHHRLIPSLGALRDRYPGIRIELNVANRNVDFVRDGFDLAIRMGAIVNWALIARRLGELALGVFAAPAYLARFGAPQAPAQLVGARLHLVRAAELRQAPALELRARPATAGPGRGLLVLGRPACDDRAGTRRARAGADLRLPRRGRGRARRAGRGPRRVPRPQPGVLLGLPTRPDPGRVRCALSSSTSWRPLDRARRALDEHQAG
jgi:DNA-binding transcriptional LysR family regulator